MGHVSLEAGRRSPLVGSTVGNAGDNGGQGNDVGGRAAEEDERDRVGGGRLPGDGEGLASGDNLIWVSAVGLVSQRIHRVGVATNTRSRAMWDKDIPRSQDE